MGKTNISVKGSKFYINSKLTYSEIENVNEKALGLLFNQRLIQGIIDDRGHRDLYKREGMGVFDPEKNTDDLISSLPQWYAVGLRAITIGLQGGWPVGMREVENMDSNGFSKDGNSIAEDYKKRLSKVIEACDDIGMVVIVNILYWAQAKKMPTGKVIRNAVKTCCNYLKSKNYTNVIIDVANEFDIVENKSHTIINKSEGISSLIDLAKTESGGMLCGSSLALGTVDKEVFETSDVIIIHGNNYSRGKFNDILKAIKDSSFNKPILCNEDSPCYTRVDVSLNQGASWGYYNNYTKQIPPVCWSIEDGEDFFFARRVMRAVGIKCEPLSENKQYKICGLAPEDAFSGGMHVLRVAAEFPEKVDYVEFFINGESKYISYDEPFFYNTETTWLGTPFEVTNGDVYKACIHLCDGRIIEKSVII